MRKQSKSNVGKGFKRTVFAAVAAAVMAISAAPATFAGENVVLAAQEEGTDETIEYESPITQAASFIFDLNPLARTFASITVPKWDRAETSGFTAKAGQRIDIASEGLPSSVSYKIGYCNSTTQYYCNAQGLFNHGFIVEKTGDYRIFVENNSPTTNLDISIYYNVTFQ